MAERPAVGVSVILFRDRQAEEVLLVQRGKAPAKGHWAPPGGSVEPGETVAEAAAREVREESGLAIRVPSNPTVTTLDRIERAADGAISFHFVLVVVLAFCEGSVAPRSGDDAAACRWWPVARLHEAQPQVEQLAEVIRLARERHAALVDQDRS